LVGRRGAASVARGAAATAGSFDDVLSAHSDRCVAQAGPSVWCRQGAAVAVQALAPRALTQLRCVRALTSASTPLDAALHFWSAFVRFTRPHTIIGTVVRAQLALALALS
jgi:uncharacterized membrane protein